jgi:hypothetical protein
MNAPAALLAVRWLVWDTFRQAQASAVFWLMLAVSLVCVLFCLLTPIDGPDAVLRLRLLLAGGVADTAGMLCALVWTAALLPTFLEPSSVTVLLAKPVPRWSLLAGKYLGVLAFVAFQAGVFVVGTWLALGLRTGEWDGRYLITFPLLVLHFAVFFSFSCLLAVMTRSAVVCIVGSLLFWLMCWGMNFGRHALLTYLAEHTEIGRGFGTALELGYWVLPKPADLGYLLSVGLGGESLSPVQREYRAVIAQGALHLEAAVLSSVAFAAVMLGLAGYELEDADY